VVQELWSLFEGLLTKETFIITLNEGS